MTNNAVSLNQAARQAMSVGDFARARDLLAQLVQSDRQNLQAWLGLATAARQLNDTSGTYAALREALRIEPRHFHALLMLGTLLERDGDVKQAATWYAAALANAPDEKYLDAPTLQAAAHAREISGRHTEKLSEYIRDHVTDARGQCSGSEQRRIDAFIDTTLRVRKRYHQNPSDYLYPGLPSIEFYDREEFPWIEEFEAQTPAFQRELDAIVREDQAGFAPYIHYDDHLPLDQWRELNHSPRWSAFHFFDRGKPIEDHCARAPAIMQTLAKLPQPQVRMRSPAAMFSVLQPKTRIPAHTGVANFRLVVHLPLIVPAHCGFRVGGETREWRVGQAWVFDDTIEHEAWNDSDQIRIIFICDVWNPRLSPEERTAIDKVIAATDAFNGVSPDGRI
ncbi:aspartyl/asparaginyl beta-hydroxylase (cupin superfamily) [Povalibacter uvarum]|uniref:Aspartyl/asparaginyl beta-hydroxylase (Cupin superfamily) n=1 Tax=Povalibacter uvarum TaxID=732238 RepID=A0A841HRS1_9GAMM|nr:aspartyl/asparaginyl beta-hydroxylase domain-containing protein [Povalibacter uvarum]MBB6094585.1 aspartyl/asparaginyl beta-hydroxylase (cupin superfamily) [Povalibacter uvarum]